MAVAEACKSQDLRDFRDRDDVAPERFLTLRGGGAASAAASLSISAGLRAPAFLEDLGAASLAAAVERRVLVGRFPATTTTTSSSSSPSLSSSSSVCSPATGSAFSLPLSLPRVPAPVSASTVVMVDEADEEERARLQVPPAAETAVEDPEENDGDRSRVRRAEERETAGLACAFFPAAASLVRRRDVPAC